MPYRLSAEREAAPSADLGEFTSLDAAAAEVEQAEEAGAWPEGHEAVATNTVTGDQYMYVDGWEPVGDRGKGERND